MDVCLFYYWVREFFASYGSNLILDDTKCIIKNKHNTQQTVYGIL